MLSPPAKLTAGTVVIWMGVLIPGTSSPLCSPCIGADLAASPRDLHWPGWKQAMASFCKNPSPALSFLLPEAAGYSDVTLSM